MARLPRRSLTALVVALAVAAGAAGAAWVGGAWDGVPGRWSTAPAQDGDQGTYEITLDGALPDAPWQAASGQFMGFSTTVGPVLHDAHGRARATMDVATDGWVFEPGITERFGEELPDWHPEDRHYWADPATGLLVGWGRTEATGGAYNNTIGQDLPVAVLESRGNNSHNLTQLTYVASPKTACALTGLAGLSIDTSDPVPTPACVLAGAFDIAATDLDAAAVEQVGPWEALRLDGEGIRVWLAREVPVAVRIEFSMPGGRATLDLTEFTAGSGSLLRGSTAADAAALLTAPRQPWLLDEAGTVHPFPLSAAFTALLSSPDAPQANALLRAGGYVAQADHYDQSIGAYRNRGWFLQVTDGKTAVAVDVMEETGPGAAGVVLHDGVYLVPRAFPAQTTAITVIEEEPASATGRFPPAHALPANMPTVASLWDRWTDMTQAPPERRPNDWGFRVRCGGDGGNCTQADLTVTAGHMRFENDLVRPEPGDPSVLFVIGDFGFAFSQLTMHADGTAVRLVEESQQLDTQAGVAALAPPGEQAPSKGLASIGSLPPPQLAAGAGLVAVLAGLAYWLWPSLKGLAPLGLFSRIEKPALLRHPVRARLVDLVQAEPGIHFQDLVRRAGTANGAGSHHLRKLCDAGLLAARPLGRYTCYFPRAPDRKALASAPLLRSDGARRLLAELQSTPGISGREAADRLGLQPSAIAYHVRRLEAAGLLHTQREGRIVRLRAT